MTGVSRHLWKAEVKLSRGLIWINLDGRYAHGLRTEQKGPWVTALQGFELPRKMFVQICHTICDLIGNYCVMSHVSDSSRPLGKGLDINVLSRCRNVAGLYDDTLVYEQAIWLECHCNIMRTLVLVALILSSKKVRSGLNSRTHTHAGALSCALHPCLPILIHDPNE